MEATATEPPSGLIAMLFADVEGSTRLAAALGAEWGGVLGAYHEIVLQIVRTQGGWVDGTAGDGFFVTFGDVSAAGRAAVAIQRELRAHPWPAAAGELKVRMGLHVGQVERGAHSYIGLEIHRAARVGAAAHGGQILMTAVASELLRDVVPAQALGAHRLKDFPAPVALFCAVVDGRGAAAFPPPRTLELREGNLPATAARLIGREHDLERVLRAVQRDGERLVTVLGRGGVGKTRLALAAANELIDDYEGGVWWIQASQERDADGLWDLIAHACRINAEGTVREAVLADLSFRGPLLLVLDNLEGVSDARVVLEALLDRLPHVTVIAASQLPVRSARERRLQLDCLEQSDALELLARCAVRLDVALADDRACAELVELLDGLPLAIELAVGRLRLFRPAELVRQLHESTTVLQDRTRADRQQSLAAALDWTLGLLDGEANELFDRLGIFAGPVELDDIEAVAGVEGTDVISAIATLIDAALLHRVETGDGVVRFGFPEAVRQEASKRLAAGDANELRRAHARWQRDLVWPLRIYEIVESRVVQRAHTLAAETQAALEWSRRQDPHLWRQLALGRYSLAHRAGSLHEQRVLLDRLLSDAGENREVVDLVRQHEAMRQARGADGLLSLFDELSDLHARFLCALNLTIVLTWERRFTDALTWNERALAVGREIGPLAQAQILLIKADTLLEAGRDQEAEMALAASENAIGELRSEFDGPVDVVRAHLASIRGAHADALDGYARALTHAELVGDRATIETVVMNLVPALARAGRAREMLEVAGILKAISTERSRHGLNPTDVPDVQRAVTQALEQMGSEGEAILDAGAALEPASWVKRTCALTYA
jgi:class 3 adenylate cyclase/predicted ATPase